MFAGKQARCYTERRKTMIGAIGDVISIVDVTAEYFKFAKPDAGQILYESGFDKTLHQEEIQIAVWLHELFGGNIKMLHEDNIGLTPDYEWRGKLWELKTTTMSSTDVRVRKGLKQIVNNPGGLIIDYKNRKIDVETVEDTVGKRFSRIKVIRTLDIIVRAHGNAIKVIRYKK